eukprot:178198-Prorocentrum_minimum.AAC.2
MIHALGLDNMLCAVSFGKNGPAFIRWKTPPPLGKEIFDEGGGVAGDLAKLGRVHPAKDVRGLGAH